MTRRIDRPVESIIETMATPGSIHPLDARSGWAAVAASPVPAWEATARLAVPVRLLRRWTVRRAEPVRVELAAWSAGSSELSVWPAAPTFARWGRHRQARYFDAAHAAADAAAALVQQGSIARARVVQTNMGGWRALTASSSTASAGSRSSPTPASPTT